MCKGCVLWTTSVNVVQIILGRLPAQRKASINNFPRRARVKQDVEYDLLGGGDSRRLTSSGLSGRPNVGVTILKLSERVPVPARGD